MSKEKKNMTFPTLRFPEFNSSGEWVEKILSQVANYENGKAHEQDIAEEGEYVVVNSKFISSDGQVKKYTNTAFCLATKGDILMVLSDVPNGKAIAKCFIVDNDNLYSVNQRICKITALDANSILLFYILNRNPYFLAFDDGIKQTNLKNEDVLNFPFLLPKDLVEQQKIASCLSSLDDLITSHTQKLDTLKAHKKGLMQQLFPAEGEKVPRQRFAEFKNGGEWEDSTIEGYIELLSGIPLKSEELSDDLAGVPILRGINITEGKIRHSKDIDKYFLGNTEEIKKYFVAENDLVIAMDGSKVGKNVALIKKDDEGAILIQRVARIRTTEKSDINYIYHHIFSEKFRNYVDKVNTSSGIPHISSQQIKEFKIGFPSLEEQQKIASCLSSLDELITAQEEKLATLKTHKKGLMQSLFPIIN